MEGPEGKVDEHWQTSWPQFLGKSKSLRRMERQKQHWQKQGKWLQWQEQQVSLVSGGGWILVNKD